MSSKSLRDARQSPDSSPDLLPYESDRPSSPSQDTSAPNIIKTHLNRAAAQRIKQGILNRPPAKVDRRDPEILPDVGSLSIQNTPTHHKNAPFSNSVSNDDMSKPVTFSGRPKTLQSCLTFCKVKLIADGVIDEHTKAGYLASLLRGPALDWLSRKLSKDESILLDYGELVAQLRKDFAVDETAEKLQAARTLAGLQQKGSVQDYANKFTRLAEDAELNDETKQALFVKGLKPRIREALIITDASDVFGDTVKEATRIDAQLYYSGRHGKAHKDGAPRRGKDGRFQSQRKTKQEPEY